MDNLSGSFQSMYLDHFGLNQSPFKITPNTGFFYTGGNRGAILDALLYAITHGEGIVKVTGEIGTGKTMLCRMLESMLPDNVEAIYLANPSLNRDEVFHAIACELGLATEGKRGDEIMRLMQDYLIEKHSTGKQVVLLVEEAQAMPLDTLEEIRLLSNLETAHHKLLQIVLFGQPELDENLGLPRMRQLKERITHSFSVQPLTSEEIPEYLMFRMRAAGYRGPDIFSAGAIKLITNASRGITRRINILSDKALLAAFSLNTHNIRPKHVKAAIEDSEFTTPRSGLTIQRIGYSATLLALGIALGAGWQQPAELPLKASVVAPIIQTSPAPAPPIKKASAPTPDTGAEPVAPPAAAEKPDVSVPAHKPLQQRLAATQSWLTEEDGANYTIQLMLLTLADANTESRLESVLNELDKEFGLAQIFVYPARITANHQFGITYGNFSTRKQALAALASLRAGHLGNRPALRTVKGIRDEITQQQMR